MTSARRSELQISPVIFHQKVQEFDGTMMPIAIAQDAGGTDM
jgi:hypothetical protein